MSDIPPLKALVFDLMGTCTDWHTAILSRLNSAPPSTALPSTAFPELAAAWRAGFFAEIHARFERGLPQEDIDATHRRVLDRLLAARGVAADEWGDDVRERLVAGWHDQVAWPEVCRALERLKQEYFVLVYPLLFSICAHAVRAIVFEVG